MGQQGPEIVFYKGKVVTVDERFSIAEALAVRDGKFQRVGCNPDIRALSDSNTEEIDLRGRTVFTGFIDTHPHVVHTGMGRASQLPLTGLQSIEDIKRRISE